MCVNNKLQFIKMKIIQNAILYFKVQKLQFGRTEIEENIKGGESKNVR